MWSKDIEFNFSERETHLYGYLLRICNQLHWKHPFGLSDQKTYALFGWSKQSLITTKNNLKKAGLIDFKKGNGSGVTCQYWFPALLDSKKGAKKGQQTVPLSSTLSDTLSDTLFTTESNPKPITSKEKDKEVDKEKRTSKDKSLEKSLSVSKEYTEHWASLTRTWFEFYEREKGIKPLFKGAEPKALKSLAQSLKTTCEQKGTPWSEQTAIDSLLLVLEYCSKNDFFSTVFELHVIAPKINSIIDGIRTNRNNAPKGYNKPAVDYGDIAADLARKLE